MDSFLLILLICGFAVLMVMLGYHSFQKQQQRLAEIRDLARELGWTFVEDADYDHDSQYSSFEIFTRGHSRYAFNTLHGTIAINGETCRVRMGDFHYRDTSGSGKSRRTRTYEFSYAIVDLPYGRLADLFIRREHMFDSLTSALGFDDIDFESAEFSKQFFVKSSDKRFAYDVIHPAMIDFLMGAASPSIDIREGKCCLSDGHRKWAPAEFRERLQWASRFFALWPKHLVAALKSV